MKKKPRIRPTESAALGTPLRDEPIKKDPQSLGKVKKGGKKPKLMTISQVQGALRAKGYNLTNLQAAILINMTVDEAVEAAKTF